MKLTILLALVPLAAQAAAPGAGAEREYRDTIRRLEFTGPPAALSDALNGLATFYFERRDYSRAERLVRQSLEVERRLDPRRDLELARRYGNLAAALAARGRYNEARPEIARAIELFERLGPSLESAYGWNTLGSIELRAGDFESAARHFERALSLWTGHPAELARGRGNLAIAYSRIGRADEAIGLFELALADGTLLDAGARAAMRRAYEAATAQARQKPEAQAVGAAFK